MIAVKIDRLLGILTTLLQREKVTAPYLAEKFEVSRRTINRDIEDICKAGIPVVTVQGTNGGIYIAEGYKIDKTIFTIQELEAIFIGLQSLNSISEEFKYNKIIDKFSGGKYVYTFKNNLLINLSSHYKTSLAPKLEMLQLAIVDKKVVRFRYYYKKGEALKTIEPHIVIFQWSVWYVLGYCSDNEEFRLFKLNRLWDLEIMDKCFVLREIPEEKTIFGNFFTEKITVVAKFDKRVKYRIVEEYGVDSFFDTEDQKILFTFPFTSKEYLLEWILTFGDKVELIQPVEIRTELAQILENTIKKYK